jgi:glycosyltransferase involved in cell wall biosynthesis
MNIFVDYHHDGLLESFYRLFENRLNHKVYRPIGLEWFVSGYWKINDQRDTAEQYLSVDNVPKDGTPALNTPLNHDGPEFYSFPREGYTQKAVTFEEFLKMPIDIIIASIPAHIEPFQKLAKIKKAKFIFQVGNDWDFNSYYGLNVLASIKKREVPATTNAIFYHQDFDTAKFAVANPVTSRKIYSFVNVYQENHGFKDFRALEKEAKQFGFKFSSFGGQCRDGNIEGPQAIADKMAEAMAIFHVKSGGDGYGHIIHNAYAMGRPVITRRSDYAGKLAGDLMTDETCIDLDHYSISQAATMLNRMRINPEKLETMSAAAAARFKELVNFEEDAERIKQWLQTLN